MTADELRKAANQVNERSQEWAEKGFDQSEVMKTIKEAASRGVYSQEFRYLTPEQLKCLRDRGFSVNHEKKVTVLWGRGEFPVFVVRW